MVLWLDEGPESAHGHRIMLRGTGTYVPGIKAVVADLWRLSDALMWNLSQLSDSNIGPILQIRERFQRVISQIRESQ